MTSVPALTSSYTGIQSMLFASYLPKLLNTALDAGIFEELREQQLRAVELSANLDIDCRVTEALCNVFVVCRLLNKEAGTYSLTPESFEFLLSDSPVNQLHDVKKYSGSSGVFDDFPYVLKNGKQADFENKMWASEKAVRSLAQGAKAGMLQSTVGFITQLPEFTSCQKMCDMAGNIGHYSEAICDHNQQLTAHVYDLPEVVDIARELQEEQKTWLQFHPFDIARDVDFGSGYDLFFVSNFLYKHGHDGSLKGFLKQVNQSMNTGGVFVSNHLSPDVPPDSFLAMQIVELLTLCMGYPTHNLPLETLERALLEAGFGKITIQYPLPEQSFPTVLVGARKMCEVE